MSRPAVHPGKVLAEELESRGVSPAELARQIAVPANRVSQIINGKRAISGDTALRLAHCLGTAPEFWLNLQSVYDLAIARQSSETAITGLPTLTARSPSHPKLGTVRPRKSAAPKKGRS